MAMSPPPLPPSKELFEQRQDAFYAKHGRYPRAVESDMREIDPRFFEWYDRMRAIHRFGTVCIVTASVLLAVGFAIALVL